MAILAATAWGPMLIPPHDQYVGAALFQLGAYCKAELETWLAFVPLDGTVVDVGANLGSHTMGFARAVGANGRVIAVEPQRPLAYMLAGSLALNNIDHVDIKRVGCGKASGSAPIARLDYNRPNNFGGLALRTYPAKDVVYDTVPVEAIDDWHLATLDFLKIDVEGMELEVLEGAKDTISRCRPVIVAEWAKADRNTELPEWLVAHGYPALYAQATPLGAAFASTGSFNVLAVPDDRPVTTSDTLTPLVEAIAA